MKLSVKSRIAVFVLAFFVWILITSVTDVQEIIIGLVVALFIALVTGKILFKSGRSVITGKILYFLLYLLVLFWEMLKANLNVVMIVVNPYLPIKPGFIKIESKLKEDTSLTILANSITLTPGTLTVDIDKDEGFLYIHWINVKSFEVNECTKLIGGRFESILGRFMR